MLVGPQIVIYVLQIWKLNYFLFTGLNLCNYFDILCLTQYDSIWLNSKVHIKEMVKTVHFEIANYSNCCGLVGLFVNKLIYTTPRVGGSNPGRSSFFYSWTWTYLQQTGVKKCEVRNRWSISREERRERRRRGKTGRRFRNGYEKGVRFVSERRLNG